MYGDRESAKLSSSPVSSSPFFWGALFNAAAPHFEVQWRVGWGGRWLRWCVWRVGWHALLDRLLWRLVLVRLCFLCCQQRLPLCPVQNVVPCR